MSTWCSIEKWTEKSELSMIYVGNFICTFFHRPKLENQKYTQLIVVYFSILEIGLEKVVKKCLRA